MAEGARAVRYKVWNPEVEGEEDGEVINAHSPGEAGEIYIAGFVGVHTDSFDLLVADEEGQQYEVTVDIDFTPNYTSWSKKVI